MRRTGKEGRLRERKGEEERERIRRREDQGTGKEHKMMASIQTDLSHADSPLGQQHRLMLGDSLKSNSTKSYAS